MADSKKTKFEVTIRYKGRKKKNWVKVIEADPEFVVDMYDDEASITIKRVEDKTDEQGSM